MSEKMIRKTAVMEIIKAHMDGEDKNTKAVLSDVMATVNEIETLEQEPCDDVVSREVVIDAIERVRNNHAYDEIEEIQKLPSVTQKSAKDYLDMADRKAKKIKDALTDNPQKSGKWIKSRDCYGNHHFTCSECGNDIATQYADNWNDKYCSECGAKMVEPQESEDKE